MYKKSKRKIIVTIIGSLILLLSLILSVILFASYKDINRKQTEMLDRYINAQLYEKVLKEQEGPIEDPFDSHFLNDVPPDYQLSTFYSVIFNQKKEILYVDEGKEIYSKDNLIGIASNLINENKVSGKIGKLKYQIVQYDGYTIVGFIDVTLIDSDITTVIYNVLIISVIAFILLFFISIYLADKIIKPLEENDKKQKQFISDASHELKTPIAIIDANAEILSREIKENEWLSNIQYESQKMNELVKYLLNLSHIENNKTSKEEINLSRIVDGEILALESLAYEQGKTIHSNILKDIFIYGNKMEITRLVSILLDNAIQHSLDKSDILISLESQRNRAILKVINQTEEISKEEQEHLFDRFYRIDEARNSNGNHYGLGLAIAKAIVNSHQGSIDVSYQDNKIEFSVLLPIK